MSGFPYAGRLLMLTVSTLSSLAADPLHAAAERPPSPPAAAGDYGVRPEDYGAKGDGVADDTAAVQAAVNAAKAAGGGAGVVSFRPGATYLVTSVDVMAGITLEGNGATIRRPDRTPGKFTRMFTTQKHPWLSDADSPPLVLRDLTLDGNRQNQGEYRNYELEHAALLFLAAAEVGEAKRGRLRAVVQNCTFKDSPADGPHVYTGVEVRFTDCTSVDCFRGGLSVTGGYSVIQISNFVGKGETHASGLQYEVDGGGFGGSMATETTVTGMIIDGDFDCGLAPGSTFLASDVLCRRPAFNMYAPGSTVQISNSRFAAGPENRIVHPGDVTFRGCVFTASEAREDAAAAERAAAEGAAADAQADRQIAAVDVHWNISGTDHKGQRLRLLDCVFAADASVDATDTTFAVRTSPDTPANDNRLVVRGGEVSAAFDHGVYVSQGGRVFLGGTRIEAATGIFWSGPAQYAVEMEVDGVTTTGPTYMHVHTSDPASVLTHRNVEAEESRAALSTRYGIAGNTYRGGRVIYVGSSPEGRLAGLAGDRARLAASEAGAVDEWVCTATGLAGAAVWKPRSLLGR